MQEHWRQNAKEQPELVNAIARMTRGAIDSGLAWEHFTEQGTVKGVAEGLATDPMFIGTLVMAGITGGLTVDAKVASTAAARAGTVAKSAKLLTRAARAQKAAGTGKHRLCPAGMGLR